MEGQFSDNLAATEKALSFSQFKNHRSTVGHKREADEDAIRSEIASEIPMGENSDELAASHGVGTNEMRRGGAFRDYSSCILDSDSEGPKGQGKSAITIDKVRR